MKPQFLKNYSDFLIYGRHKLIMNNRKYAIKKTVVPHESIDFGIWKK